MNETIQTRSPLRSGVNSPHEMTLDELKPLDLEEKPSVSKRKSNMPTLKVTLSRAESNQEPPISTPVAIEAFNTPAVGNEKRSMPKLRPASIQEQTFSSEVDEKAGKETSKRVGSNLERNSFEHTPGSKPLSEIVEEEIQYDDLVKAYSEFATRVTKKERNAVSQPRGGAGQPPPKIIEPKDRDFREREVRGRNFLDNPSKENALDLSNMKLATSLLDEQLFSMKNMNEKLEKSGLSFIGSEELKDASVGPKKRVKENLQTKPITSFDDEALATRIRNFTKYVGEVEKEMEFKNLKADPYKISLNTINPIQPEETSSMGGPKKEYENFAGVNLSSFEPDQQDDLKQRLQRAKLR
eukprot:TRINITY_DN3691_c0_g1_i2.p1 TRINITY_DN3691_c0_g1~~TRINITY_DN3691_c0_g1_i2.p1  ORF type:complete len:354 (-),score=75.37 TRINITY_DN3691_c0_g1_i2:127-1188(-)